MKCTYKLAKDSDKRCGDETVEGASTCPKHQKVNRDAKRRYRARKAAIKERSTLTVQRLGELLETLVQERVGSDSSEKSNEPHNCLVLPEADWFEDREEMMSSMRGMKIQIEAHFSRLIQESSFP